MIHREIDLLAPVCGSLSRRGYRLLQSEVPFFEYRIDIYGYSSSHNATVAVELKLSKWSRALEQALVYQLCADLCFLALPTSAAHRVEKSVLAEHGVGLIGIGPSLRCTMLIDARQSSVVQPTYRDYYTKLLQKASP